MTLPPHPSTPHRLPLTPSPSPPLPSNALAAAANGLSDFALIQPLSRTHAACSLSSERLMAVPPRFSLTAVPKGMSSVPTDITLERDAYKDTLNAIVYPMPKYDLILGKPWLTQVNPSINWRTNDLHFEHRGTPVFWTCTGFASSIRTNSINASALHFVAIASDPDASVFLAQVKIPIPPPKKEEPDMTDEVRQIVKVEFPDVFPPELPDGPPMDR
ncbi:hypothetical protein BGZ72_002430, partial [Mortierella alpina]